MSEWNPFITLKFRQSQVNDVSEKMKKNGEKFELWPYDADGKTYAVAIYYLGSLLSPLTFKPEGFLVFSPNGEVVKDLKFCREVIKNYWLWYRIYFRPVEKYVYFRKKVFSMRRKQLQTSMENCKNRYDNGLYKN